MQVRVRGKRAPDFPKNWTDIHITYLIWGEGIKTKDVEQAIALSEEKYCCVGLMLRQASHITSDYQVLEPGQNAN
jgi:putative redox protein